MRGIDMDLRRKIQTTISFTFFTALLLGCPIDSIAKKPVWISQLVFPAPQTVSAPAFLTLDMQRQRYYIVDSNKKRLLSFDSSGAPLTEFNASNGFLLPTAMTFARPGKMWVIERSNNTLLYVDLATQKIIP